jgi:hypothetical protein
VKVVFLECWLDIAMEIDTVDMSGEAAIGSAGKQPFKE